MLEAVEWKMQVVRDQQVAADSHVPGEFFVHYFDLKDCIHFSHSLCSCAEQS
jgi:hypothetical protein